MPCVEYLLDEGADVDARTRSTHETPLHKAGRAGAMQAAQVLVNRGASIVARDNMRRTATTCPRTWPCASGCCRCRCAPRPRRPGGRGAAASPDRRAADGGHAGLRRAADERGERERPVRGPGLPPAAPPTPPAARPPPVAAAAPHAAAAPPMAAARAAALASPPPPVPAAAPVVAAARRHHARRAAAAAVAAEARVGAAAPDVAHEARVDVGAVVAAAARGPGAGAVPGLHPRSRPAGRSARRPRSRRRRPSSRRCRRSSCRARRPARARPAAPERAAAAPSADASGRDGRALRLLQPASRRDRPALRGRLHSSASDPSLKAKYGNEGGLVICRRRRPSARRRRRRRRLPINARMYTRMRGQISRLYIRGAHGGRARMGVRSTLVLWSSLATGCRASARPLTFAASEQAA